jgi:hypothetical protein
MAQVASSNDDLYFDNIFIVYLDGNSPNTTVERNYVLAPDQSGTPEYTIPAALANAGVYVVVWYDFVSIGVGELLGMSDAEGTITFRHPNNAGVTATLDVIYTAPTDGGQESLGEKPGGGFA